MSYTMPRPTIPGQEPLTVHDVQAAWDYYVRPAQERKVPQSVEMRVLMAILRAAYIAYRDAPEGPTMALPAPVVAPIGWEVNQPELVAECRDTFLGNTITSDPVPRPQLALGAILDSVQAALR